MTAFVQVTVLPLIFWFCVQGSTGKGYLAQHQLFDQVSACFYKYSLMIGLYVMWF